MDVDTRMQRLAEFIDQSPESYRDANGQTRQATFITFEDNKSFPYMYFRKPDGWITHGQGWAQEVSNAIECGWTPLLKYGKFPATDPQGRYRLGTDPYYVILMNGGAKEFPLDQILEHNWDKKPPYPGIEFPQLKDVHVQRVKCTQCFREFLKDSDLTKHESVAHRTVAQNEQMARNLSGAISQVLTAQGEKEANANEGTSKALMMIAQVLEQQAKAQEQQGQILAALLERQGNPVGRPRKVVEEPMVGPATES